MLNLRNNDFLAKKDPSLDELWKRSSFPSVILRDMRTDTKSSKKEYTVIINVPGYQKEDITISIDDGALIVIAEKAAWKSDAADHEIITHERCEGHCECRIRLLDDVDLDRISAKVENGVLTNILPKKELPQKEIITVTIE